VNRGRHMNDLLDDRTMVVMMAANRGHRKSDLRLDAMDDRKMVVNRGRHRNDLLGDRKMDGMTDASRDLHRNVLHLDVMDDQNLSAVDGNHDLRMNDLHLDVKNLDVTDDLKMVGNLYHHMSDLLGDRKMDGMTDARRGHRMNDLHLDVKNLDGMTDANRGHHRNVLHLDERSDRKMDVNLNCHRGIRKCALPALNLGAKKTGDLKKSCDQLSRDHLQCDHRKLRHRGKNLNLAVKNLGVKMTIDPQCCDLTQLRHVRMNYRGNPMKVDQKMGAKDASRMRNYGHLDDPVNGTMIYLQAWLLLFLKLGESDRYSVMFLKYCKVLIIRQIWN
jgi:hypothetical protein